MVFPGVDKGEAMKAAERVRSMIANHVFEYGENQPLGFVSISGGVATWPMDADDIETLVARADEALYRGKKQGRNAVFAHETPHLSPDGDDPFNSRVIE